MKKLFLCLFVFLTGHAALADLKPAFYLNKDQAKVFKKRMHHRTNSRLLIALNDDFALIKTASPHPIIKINYEGLLDTDPQRQNTEKSLEDMNNLVTWLNHYYAYQDKFSLEKMKAFILAWTKTYEPTGNPINENKFEPVWISYAVIAEHFDDAEKNQIEDWLLNIVQKLQSKTKIPMNNWQSKKIKMLGTIGLILKNTKLVEEAVIKSREYINISLYPDGTSRDLKERDALSYHVAGIDPLLAFAINLHQFQYTGKKDLYNYQSDNGSSIKNSVDYVRPFATGEQKRQEWINSTVTIDKRRAKAGIEEYQPGRYFKPIQSLTMFEMASYFDKTHDQLISKLAPQQSLTGLIFHIIRT